MVYYQATYLIYTNRPNIIQSVGRPLVVSIYYDYNENKLYRLFSIIIFGVIIKAYFFSTNLTQNLKININKNRIYSIYHF